MSRFEQDASDQATLQDADAHHPEGLPEVS
jgi:hypothetical protein